MVPIRFSCIFDILGLQNVARGLTAFLLKLLPPTCDHENNLKLFTELCKLAVSVLQKPRTPGKFNFDTVISFIETLLTTYGNILGCASDNSIKVPVYGKDIESMVTSMIWKVIDDEKEYLGLALTSSMKGSEQGNGQSAYESKAASIQKPPAKKTNMESLYGVLSILTTGLNSCPAFTMSIAAMSPTENVSSIDQDQSSEILIRLAAGAASMSLDEHHDTDMVHCAVVFLLSLVRFHVMLFFFSFSEQNFSPFF